MGNGNMGKVALWVAVVVALSLAVIWFMYDQDRVVESPPENIPPSSEYTPPPEQVVPETPR